MSGKNKDKLTDLEADFFGDEDLDWLDEDSEVVQHAQLDEDPTRARRRRRPPGAGTPAGAPGAVAPPPPPPFAPPSGAGGSVVPRDQKEAERARMLKPVLPSELSKADTLIFSQVPTLPPIDEDLDAPARTAGPADDEPTVVHSPRPSALTPIQADPDEYGDEDLPTMSADLPPTPPAAATEGPAFWPSGALPEPPTLPPRPPPVFGPGDETTEAVFADETGEEPLVRTHDPAPIRMEVPERVVSLPPSAAPDLTPRATLPPFQASGDGAWRDVVTALMNEAAVAGPEERTDLLFRAGWVYRHELSDLYGAESLYRDALSGGSRNPALLRELADLCLHVGRWADAAELLHERAGLLEGRAAAESLRECAELHLRRLQNPGAGVARLWDALEAHPDDYASLVLLREQLSDVQPERVAVLERLATLSEGAVAADVWAERGHLLESTDPAAAITSYRAALAAWPEHAPSFLALESLLQRGSDARHLADLYLTEASSDPIGAGWWHMAAGRALLLAGETDAGERAYARASQLGWTFAFRERQARLIAGRAWPALEACLAEEAAGASGPLAPFIWFHLGWVRERHIGDLDGALEAYGQAAQRDPHATPAADAARRVLRRKGDPEALTRMLEGLLPAASPAQRHTLLFRLAETAEDAGRLDDARRWFEAVLEIDPGHVSSMAGLGRVLLRMERWDSLSALLVRRAEAVDGSDLKAHFLYEAASVGRTTALADSDALALHLRALEQVPDHLPSLEVAARILAASDRWPELGSLLQTAADATADRRLKLDLFYRAGRVFATRTHDRAAARSCLTACLEMDADHEPALQLSLDLSAAEGDYGKLCTWYRGLAARAPEPGVRDWTWFASALMSGLDSEGARTDLRALLAGDPDHVGGRMAWELVALVAEDWDALADICRATLVGTPSTGRARTSVRLADILVRRGRTEDASAVLADLATMDVADRPLRPAARIARAAGGTTQAASLLGAVDAPWAHVERVGLLSHRRRDRDQARKEASALLDRPDGGLGAGWVAARVGAVCDDKDLMARGQELLARQGTSTPMRAACAWWAASLREDLQQLQAAEQLYALAMEIDPAAVGPRAGALRCRMHLGDVSGVQALATAPHVDGLSVASALHRMGDPEGGLAQLHALLDSRPILPVLLHLERAQESAGDWSGAYTTLVRRLDVSRDETQRRAIERKRRWILAEKLAHTDEAWSLYQQLHTENPADRDVTEALARIAGARGDLPAAIGYLGELARGTSDPAEAARYQRRVAEAHITAGDRAAARQAFLDALDHAPTDAAALEGLKALATEAGDWTGLVQILQREADLVDGERKLASRRAIARINEDRLKQGRVAIEAWRAVLEVSPQDDEALTRLLALAEAEREWGVFVETGNVLAALARGAERTSLLRRIGVVCVEQLKRDDAVRYFEQAIAEEPPDLEAARRLEEMFRKKGEWKGVARALDVQGRVAPTPEERVAALVRAARLELETRHDRDAAAAYYQRVLKVQPDHEAALRFMASHLFEAGRFDEALPVCERLEPMVENGQDLEDFDTRMELAQFYFYFAEMLRLAGDDGAMTRYARALELNPTHLASLEAVGPLYCNAKQWQKAERVYRQLLQLSGGQGERHKVANTYTQLGLVERALGHGDKAQKRFNKALEIYPNHVEALKGMALLLEDQEDWSNLLNIYNNIIYHATVAEDVIDAYMTKGRILDDHMTRPDKAAQHYQRSLDFKPDQPIALLRMAELAMRRDDHQAAGELADRALKIDRDEARAVRAQLLIVRAAAWQDAGRADEAQAALAEARKLPLGKTLGPGALEDLEGLRQLVKENLPR